MVLTFKTSEKTPFFSRKILSKSSRVNVNGKLMDNKNPVDTGRKLNVHRRSEDVLDVVLCTFNLRPVSTGKVAKVQMSLGQKCTIKFRE